MENYKLENLLNTIKNDYKLYNKVLNEIAHIQLKHREYGIKLSAADNELLDRIGELVEKLASAKNQLEEMVK
jgi:predicted patatin/cPLA2 family phospholipase